MATKINKFYDKGVCDSADPFQLILISREKQCGHIPPQTAARVCLTLVRHFWHI